MGAYEIIVADNNSPVGLDAVAKVISGRARLVIVHEAGAGPARNGGVAVATGEILAFIDSDCRATPEWLAAGVAALDHFDFVGGRVDVSVEDDLKASPTEAFEKVFAFNFESYINQKGFTGSGNLFVWRKAFSVVGGFRAGVSEDVEWSRRARLRGFRLGYAPEAAIAHPARKNWAELQGKWSRINRETYRLQLSHRGGRALWLLRAFLLPPSAFAHAPKVLLSKKLKSRSERLGALVILFRCRMWRFLDALKLSFSR
jgi:glycosyltransferase involved in cell wall biosynthesis